MNNFVSDKTMENIRKRVYIKLVRTDGTENDKIITIIAKHNIIRRAKFSDDLSAIHLLYDWYYNTLKKKYGKKTAPCTSETDSLLVDIKTPEAYNDMAEMKTHYDLSDYPKDHPLYD